MLLTCRVSWIITKVSLSRFELGAWLCKSFPPEPSIFSGLCPPEAVTFEDEFWCACSQLSGSEKSEKVMLIICCGLDGHIIQNN